MKPLIIAAALLGLATACSKKPVDDTAATPAAQPAAPATATPATTAPTTATTTPVANASADPAAETFEFEFTALHDKATSDPRVVKLVEGPCGATPVARVTRMPLQDTTLQPDFVVEFDASGKEVKRWGKPYEARVLGLDGDRLFFRVGYDAPQDYWTDLSGAIGRVQGDATKTDAKTADETAATFACPALPSFSKSEYEQCYELTDNARTKRRLAWESACS